MIASKYEYLRINLTRYEISENFKRLLREITGLNGDRYILRGLEDSVI